MALSLADKLKIKQGFTVIVLNKPSTYNNSLGKLPADVKIIDDGKKADQVHWFVRDKAQLHKEIKKVLPLVKGNTICWIIYPKGTSKIQTDLTRDTGWEELMKLDLQWVNLISFDETWSAFGLREKTEADRKKEEKPKERPIFEYADSATKTIRLPDDLRAAFKKNKKEETFFNTLPFSHKREYIEWIVTAKREETRAARIDGTIERLKKNWRNPANR